MLTEFGKFLRVIRMNNGEKAAEMAKKLFISPSYLYMIENGERAIPTDMENNILSAYSMSDDDKLELHRLVVYREHAEENSYSQMTDNTANIANDSTSEKRSKTKNIMAVICVGVVAAVIATVVISVLWHSDLKKKKPETDITSTNAIQTETIVKGTTVEELITELLSTTITEQQAKSYQSLSVEELREKINTIGDAILFLDTFNCRFFSDSTDVYNPVGNINNMKTMNETDSTKYTFLAGYFVQDNIPGIECIYTAFEADGYMWPCAALLIPTTDGYFVFSPGMFSSIKGNSNCMINYFKPCIISDKSELKENLESAGIINNGHIGTVYVFTPDDKTHTFQLLENIILCNNLTPIE